MGVGELVSLKTENKCIISMQSSGSLKQEIIYLAQLSSRYVPTN